MNEPARQHNQQRQPATWITVVVIILCLLGALKVAGNYAAKNTPPAACQIWGGQWTPWLGWQCA